MSSTNNVGAFGAGWATGQWDPLAYIRKPQVILRLLAWVSSSAVSTQQWAWSFSNGEIGAALST